MTSTVIVGSFLTCILSGLVPVVNGEVVVVAAALLVTPPELAPLVVVCAAGQMLAKLGLYGAARWAPRRLPRRARESLGRASVVGRSRAGATLMVLASAGAGLPPFYLVTLAAGVVRVPLAVFAAAGMLGTLIRYSVLAWGATHLAGGPGLPLP